MNRTHHPDLRLSRRQVLCGGLTAPAIASPAASGRWFHTATPRIYLVDFQLPDPADQSVPGMPRFLERWDTARIVDQVIAANGSGVLVHTKCHEGNAYYRTRAGHQHSNLGGRDLMAEFSRLCRAKKLTLLFYYSIGWEHRAFMTHPEWRAVNAKGEPVARKGEEPLHPHGEPRWTVCWNSGYHSYVSAMLEELCRGYDFDGFWLDMPGTAFPCYCESCSSAYRKASGAAIPPSPGDDEAGRKYRKWVASLNARILRGFGDLVHSINRNLTVSSNGGPFPNEFPFDSTDSQDYLSREFHYPEGPSSISLYSAKFQAVKPGVPFEMESWRDAFQGRGARSRGFQVRPWFALLTEMAGVAAHGGWPQYYDQIRMDGTLDPRSLDAVAPAFAAVRERQAWWRVGQPVPYAMLLWSKASDFLAGSDARSAHGDGMAGAWSALMEQHLPVGVVTERAAAQGQWRGAEVMILPCVESLPAECIRPLREFVESGRGLVVTGRTSLRDGDGRLLDNFSLADLTGVDFAGMTRTWYTFLRLDGAHPLCSGLPGGFGITVNETLQTLGRVREGTAARGEIVLPVPGFKMGAVPGLPAGYPAITTRTVGKGRVVWIAASLGAMYERFSLPEVGRLLGNAARWAAGSAPAVSASAPGTVEIVPWRDDRTRRTVIHAINRTGAGLAQRPGQMMHEVIPVHDVEIRIARESAERRVRAQPGNRPLEFRRTADGIVIRVPRIDIWEIVEIA